MRVLVACEESQAVCKAFRALGHEACSGCSSWDRDFEVVPAIETIETIEAEEALKNGKGD